MGKITIENSPLTKIWTASVKLGKQSIWWKYQPMQLEGYYGHPGERSSCNFFNSLCIHQLEDKRCKCSLWIWVIFPFVNWGVMAFNICLFLCHIRGNTGSHRRRCSCLYLDGWHPLSTTIFWMKYKSYRTKILNSSICYKLTFKEFQWF